MFTKRQRAFFTVILAISVVFAGKLAWLQIIDGENIANAATSSRTQTITLNASRGKIVDANGTILATSLDTYDLYVDKLEVSKFVPTACKVENKNSTDGSSSDSSDSSGSTSSSATSDSSTSTAASTSSSTTSSTDCNQIDGKPVEGEGAVAVAKLLASVLDENYMELGAKINGTDRYIVIEKGLSLEKKNEIEKLNLGNCIGFNLRQKRVYTNATVAGPIVGSVDSEDNGNAGVELMLNSDLKGTSGSYSYEQGLNGDAIPVGNSTRQEAQDGKNVKLTIDSAVQQQVQQYLDEGAKKYSPSYGIAIVEEVKTGKIIAIADANSASAGSDSVVNNPSKAITALFEPGSTSKAITCSALLNENIAHATDKYYVADHYTVDGQTFSDSEDHGVEKLTLTGILAQSSNVGTVIASTNMSNETKYKYLTAFGVNQSSGINFPGESSGHLTDYNSWDARTQYTVLFGQGYSTSAVQMTNVFATIANKGMKPNPQIIAGIDDGTGNYAAPEQKAQERVISEDTANEVMKMLEKTVTNGNVYGIDVPGYRVAGKTGTSEMAGSSGSLSDIMASFIGVFPVEDPQYVVSVFYKNPQGAYFGALSAAPVANNIMKMLASNYAIPTSGQNDNNLSTTW